MKMLIVGFVIAMLSKFFADEFKEWMAWLPPKLIRWAARHLPSNCDCERFEEEWLAHCNDLPGSLAKLWHALGCAIVYLRCANVAGKVTWCTLAYPLAEVAFGVHIIMIIMMGAVGISYWGPPQPELARLRRLRKNAGGLTVLGFNDLDLKPEDNRLLELVSTISQHRWMVVAEGIMFPEFTRKYFTSRFRFLFMIHGFFFGSVLPPF